MGVWAERIGVEIVKGKENEDPASVAFQGMQKAKEIGADLVIVDTAGRLQTKTNLMAELSKIRRVIAKEIEMPPTRFYLLLMLRRDKTESFKPKPLRKQQG